jgi:hypothetical protein
MVDAIGVLMVVILCMIACGETGKRIARSQNRNPLMGMIVGAAFPLAGIGLLMMLGPKSKGQGG